MKTQTQMLTTFMFIISLVLIAPCTYALDTTRVSVSTASIQSNGNSFFPALNEKGNFVAFHSFADNLVAGDTNQSGSGRALDVFVRNRQTGETTRVSVATGGAQGNNSSRAAALSNDGNWVAFESDASNLVLGDTLGFRDIFVHDRQTATTTRVSLATGAVQSNGASFNAALSGDGRFVAFESEATNLVANDTNGDSDIFVHDRQTGITSRVSLATGAVQAIGDSFMPTISNDGRFVAFESEATNLVLGDTNGDSDIFVHDRQTGITSRVSLATGAAQAIGDSFWPTISNDGRFVAFESEATNLVVGDTNGFSDLFRHDRQTGVTVRVSVPTGGFPQSNEDSFEPAMSGDGRFVAFLSYASNLVAGDTNGEGDVFVRDTQTNMTTRVSVATGGEQGNDFSCNPAISQDGRIVAFFSDSTNLVLGDTNGLRDIFVRDSWQIAGIGDIDGNGTADMVWRDTTTGSVAAWLMDGLSVSSSGVLPGAPSAAWVIEGVGDLDGDGKTDLVWRDTTTGVVAVWLMDGLNPPTKGVYPGFPAAAWVIEGVGDVNDDDKADLVWRNTTTGVVAVWLVDGLNPPIKGVYPGFPAAAWVIEGVGDVNDDDKADLVWRNTTTGVVAVWLVDGLNPPIKSVYPGFPAAAWVIVGMGDLDGDGKVDLVWRNTADGSVAAWLVDGLNPPTKSLYPGFPAAAWVIDGVGDLDADGKTDLVWRHTTTGVVAAWLVDGLNPPTKGLITGSVP